MTELTCQQCQELAAELALDILPSHERAQVLAHLDHCPSCQDTVCALTMTADRLVELLPQAEPPAGFEQRVINALTPPPPRTRRRWLPAAAGLLALTLATAGWTVSRATHDPTPSPPTTQAPNDARAGQRTVLYAPLSTAERQVGQAYLYPGHPSWVYLSLDTDSTTTDDTIKCEVIRQDGSAVSIGTFAVTHGRGTWGGPALINRDTLTSARLINSKGHTLARAHFIPPSKKPDQPTPRHHTEHQQHGHS
jgi:putative zinc finger protein